MSTSRSSVMSLSGTLQQRPRWQRGVVVVDSELGDAIGPIYARRYFSPQAKEEAEALVAHIIAVYRERLGALSWMAPATKAEAVAKLNALYVGVGYGENWRDYSGYQVKPDDIFRQPLAGPVVLLPDNVARIGRPVNRKEWSMTPQTVNAVNLPLQNALNFPAAILQPPFYDPAAPAAANYGAIGAIIGHEISHTSIRRAAPSTPRGACAIGGHRRISRTSEPRQQKLAAQYDTYKPFPDLSVNGKQTLAEDIADVAGVSAAYDGYHAALKGNSAPVEHGFTGDQQFFIAFGQNWALKSRPAALREQVMTDSHAPGSTVRTPYAMSTHGMRPLPFRPDRPSILPRRIGFASGRSTPLKT